MSGDRGGGREGAKKSTKIGPACQKYHCKVCDVAIISYDLKHHYSSLTWLGQIRWAKKL